MTTFDNQMSKNSYWERVQFDPTLYFDEFSPNFFDDDYDDLDTIVNQEMNGFHVSPSSSNEVDPLKNCIVLFSMSFSFL